MCMSSGYLGTSCIRHRYLARPAYHTQRMSHWSLVLNKIFHFSLFAQKFAAMIGHSWLTMIDWRCDWQWRSRMLKKTSVGRIYSKLLKFQIRYQLKSEEREGRKKKGKAWHPFPKGAIFVTPLPKSVEGVIVTAWPWRSRVTPWLSRLLTRLVSLLYINTYVHNFAKK